MNTYTNQQIQNTLSIITSSIVNCEKTQPQLKEGSASLSLSKNRIKALYISKALLTGEETAFTKEEAGEGGCSNPFHQKQEHNRPWQRQGGKLYLFPVLQID